MPLSRCSASHCGREYIPSPTPVMLDLTKGILVDVACEQDSKCVLCCVVRPLELLLSLKRTGPRWLQAHQPGLQISTKSAGSNQAWPTCSLKIPSPSQNPSNPHSPTGPGERKKQKCLLLSATEFWSVCSAAELEQDLTVILNIMQRVD